MIKKAMLRYRLTELSSLSGKTEENQKKAGGMYMATQKTNRSLKTASSWSVVRWVKKIEPTQKATAPANTQNLLLILFAGFLKSTRTPSPAISRNRKMNTDWLANINYIPKA